MRPAAARPTVRTPDVHRAGVSASTGGDAGRRRGRASEDPRVRLRRGRADRDALLRRARRDGAAHRVEDAARLPARVRARPEQPARPRGLADVRRAQRRQAQRHAQPEASRRRRARAAARRRVGRRGRRELRAAGDAGLRARLRRARRDQARPRDGQRVPQRPDRSAQGLPRLRRPGLRARGLQRAHRLARPRAGRPVRHDHRLARAPLRRDRARRRAALPAPHRAAACTSTSRRSSRAIYTPVAVAARLRASTASSGCATATGTPRAVPHGAFPCADEGGVGDRWVAIACRTDDRVGRARARHRRRRSRRSRRSPARTARDDEVEALVAAWTRDADAAPRSPSSCRRPASRRCRSRTSATSTTIRSSRPAATSSRTTHPVPRRRPLRAQRLPALATSPSGLRPGRPDARPGHRLGARRPARARRRREIDALRASGAVE